MTQVIEKAKKRLAEIEAEAERLRTFIGVYADLTGDKVEDSEEPDNEYSGTEGVTASPGEIVEGAKLLMREHKRPLSRSRIVKLLIKQGLLLPGADKAKNVGTVIWRSKQFDNIAGYGYWPKEFGGWLGQGPPPQAAALGENVI